MKDKTEKGDKSSEPFSLITKEILPNGDRRYILPKKLWRELIEEARAESKTKR